MKYRQLHVQVSEEMYKTLKTFSQHRNTTIASVARSALQQFIEAKNIEGIDAVLERLALADRKSKGIRRDIENLGELVSFYVYHWFCYTPAMPEQFRQIRAVEGRERHQKFLEQLNKKISRGNFSLNEVKEETENKE